MRRELTLTLIEQDDELPPYGEPIFIVLYNDNSIVRGYLSLTDKGGHWYVIDGVGKRLNGKYVWCWANIPDAGVDSKEIKP